MNWPDAFPVWGSAAAVALHVLFLLYILYCKTGDPSGAAFWLMTAAVFPLGGFVLFLFFGMPGRRRMTFHIAKVHARMRNAHARRRMFGEEIARLDRALTRFVADTPEARAPRNAMLDRLFPESPLLTGNHTELLIDGTEAYPRMLSDIAAAKVAVRLQSFILTADEVGRRFLDALEKKADEGVDVKILFDSFGSFRAYFSTGFRRALRKRRPHLAMRAFSPLNLYAPWLFQMRNHRKLLVIDGRIAYTGGINISAENERLEKVPPSRYIHDLHCRITGPAVAQFAMSFFRDWSYAVRRHPDGIAVAGELVPPEKTGEDTLRVIQSGPGCHDEGSRDLFYAAAMQARESLTVLTPYFVPGAQFSELLCMVAARGVDVRIIVPKHNNHKFVDLAARSVYGKLLEYGVRIYEKRGTFSHIKALLADGSWGFMGSSNCDNRSFRLNYELDFWFEGGPAAEALGREIREELAECDEVTLFDAARKKVWRQLLENACALLSPVL